MSYIKKIWRYFFGEKDPENAKRKGESISPLEFPDMESEKLFYLVVNIELYIIPIFICLIGATMTFFIQWWIFIPTTILALVFFLNTWANIAKENPIESVGMITAFGRPVAYFRRGGPIPDLFLLKTKTEVNKNIQIRFGKDSSGEKGDIIPIGCASPLQAQANRQEFIKTFDDADYKPHGLTGARAYKNAVADTRNHVQILLKPEITVVLEIWVDEEQNEKETLPALENIRRWFKNVEGENRGERITYVTDQLRENFRSQLNTQFKKYSYSMLTLLITTDALDKKLRGYAETLIQKQGLGLKIISLKLTALGASADVHTAQDKLAISSFTAEETRITARGEADAIKIKADAEKEKLIKEGEGKAQSTKSVGLAELDVLEKTLEKIKGQVGSDNAEALLEIVRLEYRLEEAKQYANMKAGTVIVKDQGSNQGGQDNIVNTALLVEAIKNLSKKISS